MRGESQYFKEAPTQGDAWPSEKKTREQLIAPNRRPIKVVAAELLANEVRDLILQARQVTAQAVNSVLVHLYWQIGRRIHTEILKEKRADYGEEIVPTLSAQLMGDFGNGFSTRNLFRMIRFAEVFSNQEVVTALSRQLGWSHFVEIIPLKDELQREFYAEMCRVERWSVRTLRAKVKSMLFERTALSRKPDLLARQELAGLREEDRLTPDLVFRDPYDLDFLGLADSYSANGDGCRHFRREAAYRCCKRLVTMEEGRSISCLPPLQAS